jgi:head-tail adaptor
VDSKRITRADTMQSNRLDRRGTFLANTPSQGVGGAVVDQFVPVASVWIARESISSRAIISGARDASDTETVFVCRFRTGIDVNMYLDTEGRRYRITRVDEIGRREWLKVYGKAVE